MTAPPIYPRCIRGSQVPPIPERKEHRRLDRKGVLRGSISFAYTSSDRPAQNTLAIQPAVLFSLWDGWYLRSADATWVYGWRRHSPSLLPLSLGVGRVMVRPGLSPLNFYVA